MSKIEQDKTASDATIQATVYLLKHNGQTGTLKQIARMLRTVSEEGIQYSARQRGWVPFSERVKP